MAYVRARTDAAKRQPEPPLLLRAPNAPLTGAALQALADHVMAQAAAPATIGSQHDRLFDAVMALVDVMQADREAYRTVVDRILQRPELWPLALRLGGGLAKTLLARGELLVSDRRQPLQVAGLLAVLAATLRAWQADGGADLSATLRACDTALRRGATAAAWLGFV